jgi:hypothetical protein
MRKTLLVSVAAVALTAASTLAWSQGSSSGAPGGGSGGVSAPQAQPGGGSASPSTPHAAPGARSEGTGGAAPAGTPGTPNGQISETPAPGKATQDKSLPEKQRTGQQAPSGKQDKQQQGQAAPQDQPGASKQGASGQQPGGSKQTETAPSGGAKSGTAERSGGAMKSSNVSLTTEQKTTIRTKVLTSSAPRVTNVNFDIKVGTVVPRTVRVAPLPPTLVEIEPTWRGYMYFVYQDEIIVVEPGTLRIVAVLEV